MNSPDHLIRAHDRLQPYRAQLKRHPIFREIATFDDIQLFMEYHVFAAWDFMCLLKSLQRRLTCVDVRWHPEGDPSIRRLVNELVLEEESDDRTGGPGYVSHFEFFREAMRQAGASTAAIDGFVSHLAEGTDVPEALRRANAPRGVRPYVQEIYRIATEGSTAGVAAALALGALNVVPDLYEKLSHNLLSHHRERITLFLRYLSHHATEGTPLQPLRAVQILEHVCGENAQRWEEAEAAASRALRARLDLWDDLLETMLPA